MEIEKASETGFCLGVRRALELLEKAVQQYGPLETLGAVVHNRQVASDLARLGVKAVEGLEQVQGKVVAIPSHGASRQVIEEIQRRGLQMVDTTCPRVLKAQRAAQKLARAGFSVVIFGDAQHPEIRGVLGWTEGKGIVTMDSKIAWGAGRPPRRLGVLCQTTQNLDNFAHFVNQLLASLPSGMEELRIINTICDATKRRQEATLELARRVDSMIVVGGYNSANTRRLAEVCASAGVETHHIETAAEVKDVWLKGQRIGVTAGASTPDHVIEEVVSELKTKGEIRCR